MLEALNPDIAHVRFCLLAQEYDALCFHDMMEYLSKVSWNNYQLATSSVNKNDQL